MKKKRVRKIQTLYYHLLKPFGWLIAIFKYHYKVVNRYKLAKGERAVLLSNHQTDLDPVFVQLPFNRLFHTVATDNIFKKGFICRFLNALGAIPKRKGQVDLRSAMEMGRVIKEGGSLLLFPEGNRSYAEFQYFIANDIGKHLKRYQATIILFNLHGGFGKSPRFAHKNRKGPLYGEIKRILKYDEYKDMSDEELFRIIKDNLKVYDSDSGHLYRSKRKAEYLERMLFACPICKAKSSLVSKGNYVRCSSCGLEVQYTENLYLVSDNPDFKFNRLVDWYNFQKDWIKDLKINDGETIFEDKKVVLSSVNPFEKKRKISKGDMSVTDKELIIDKISFDLKDIEIASPVSGRKLVFTCLGQNYEVRGEPRFNALKYVLLFNKLDTKMKADKIDNYFSLEKEIS